MPEDEAIAQAAKALFEAARGHKRAAATHRRAAKKCMADLAGLREKCAGLGLKLDIRA